MFLFFPNIIAGMLLKQLIELKIPAEELLHPLLLRQQILQLDHVLPNFEILP